jgi:hypothetical protein
MPAVSLPQSRDSARVWVRITPTFSETGTRAEARDYMPDSAFRDYLDRLASPMRLARHLGQQRLIGQGSSLSRVVRILTVLAPACGFETPFSSCGIVWDWLPPAF